MNRSTTAQVWLRLDAHMLPSDGDALRWRGLRAVGYAGPGRDGAPADMPTFQLTRAELAQYLATEGEAAAHPLPLQHLNHFLLMLAATAEALEEAEAGGDFRVPRQAVREALQALFDSNIAALDAAAVASAPRPPPPAPAEAAPSDEAVPSAHLEEAAASEGRVEAGAFDERRRAFVDAQAVHVHAKERELLVEWREALSTF